MVCLLLARSLVRERARATLPLHLPLPLSPSLSLFLSLSRSHSLSHSLARSLARSLSLARMHASLPHLTPCCNGDCAHCTRHPVDACVRARFLGLQWGTHTTAEMHTHTCVSRQDETRMPQRALTESISCILQGQMQPNYDKSTKVRKRSQQPRPYRACLLGRTRGGVCQSTTLMRTNRRNPPKPLQTSSRDHAVPSTLWRTGARGCLQLRLEEGRRRRVRMWT
jgi:hypothetical protein